MFLRYNPRTYDFQCRALTCRKVEPRQVPKGHPFQKKSSIPGGEIASYFQREIRTVQRWENDEGLPIHRHEHKKKSTVYAYTSELDDWFKRRQPEDDPEADAAFVPEPDVDVPSEMENDEPISPAIPDEPAPRRGKRIALLLAATAIFALPCMPSTIGFKSKR
jgi:hypothetical protein